MEIKNVLRTALYSLIGGMIGFLFIMLPCYYMRGVCLEYGMLAFLTGPIGLFFGAVVAGAFRPAGAWRSREWPIVGGVVGILVGFLFRPLWLLADLLLGSIIGLGWLSWLILIMDICLPMVLGVLIGNVWQKKLDKIDSIKIK